MLKNIFPPVSWLASYNAKSLKSDIVAGITLAAYGIPVSLAYATLAGLPPQYGIYGYLLGGFFYAMLGTGRQLAIGPTSAISLLIGTTIAGMAQGDMQRWADIASLTALVFACMAIIAYLLRLSGIINFISETVLVGFKAGAALTIALTQLPKLFGTQGGGDNFFERLIIIIRQVPETNPAVFIFGAMAIAILIIGEKLLPGRPVAIIVVIISIIVINYSTVGSLGLKVVGLIPSGLPDFRLPSLRVSDVDGVIPLAFACFLLSYIESVSAAKTLAQKHGYEINSRQELLALGVANGALAFGQGYPVAGGLSQSSVNDTAGAKTPASLIFASIAIAICLLYLTGMLTNLPLVILAAIVLVAIRGLFDLKEFRNLYRLDKREFMVAITALSGVIVFGILKGVLLAAVVTLLLLIKATSTPHVAFLGRIPGTGKFSDLARHPENEIIPGFLVVRVEASLLYFNTEFVRHKVLAAIETANRPVQCVIFDLSSSPHVDIAGARLLARLAHDLQARGIKLEIAEALHEVRDLLRSEIFEGQFDHINRLATVNDLVEGIAPKKTEADQRT